LANVVICQTIWGGNNEHLQVFGNFDLAKKILLVPEINKEASGCQLSINAKKEGEFVNLL